MTDYCARCQAPIRWVRLEGGAQARIDAPPSKHGDWVFDAKYVGETRVEHIRRHLPLIDGDKPRYTKHVCGGMAA